MNGLAGLGCELIDAQSPGALERFLALRRYINWCAQRQRFEEIQGAQHLFAEC